MSAAVKLEFLLRFTELSSVENEIKPAAFEPLSKQMSQEIQYPFYIDSLHSYVDRMCGVSVQEIIVVYNRHGLWRA